MMLVVSESRDPRRASRAEVLGVEGLATFLERERPEVNAWWSPHIWRGDVRSSQEGPWESSAGIAVDVDYKDDSGRHAPLPDDLRERCEEAARRGDFSANIFHATPSGARFVYAFQEQCTSREEMGRANEGAVRAVRRDLEKLGYDSSSPGVGGPSVDEGATRDEHRLFFVPNGPCNKFQPQQPVQHRRAAVIVAREAAWDPKQLGAIAALPAEPEWQEHRGTESSFREAAARWCREHAPDPPYPTRPGAIPCPACGSSTGFKRLRADPTKWYCFGANKHPATEVGHRAGAGYVGDELDIEAWRRGISPMEVLRADGYLDGPAASRAARGSSRSSPAAAPFVGSDEFHLKGTLGVACRLLRDPGFRRDTIGPGEFEYNELLLLPVLGRRPLREHHLTEARERAEWATQQRYGKAIAFPKSEWEAAVEVVARQRSFHPVRDYLARIRWDGTPRLREVARRVLGSDPQDQLAATLVEKWFIAAAARALTPGTKVDNVLILMGPQGALKSTFFRTLAGQDAFGDTAFEPGKKDGYLALHRTWIYEWSELETLKRAATREAAKAFLSSAADTFRRPYGHIAETEPRAFVIVGTTNEEEVLSDSTGSRRFWIVRTGPAIDIAYLEANRDQLWAEAVKRYRAGENWWLSPAEEQELADANRDYEYEDPWRERVLSFASSRGVVTSADVLDELHSVLVDGQGGATIRKEAAGRWHQGSQTRVGRILHGAEYKSVLITRNKVRMKAWRAPEARPDATEDHLSPASSQAGGDTSGPSGSAPSTSCHCVTPPIRTE